MSKHLNTYRPDIDGLRSIAIIIVVAFHYFPQMIPGGYLGVDIFFVISGYLITQILISQQNSSIRDFYARRIARLVPALAVVLLFALVAGWFLLLPNAYMRLGKHIVSGAGFFSNITYLKEVGYFDLEAHSKVLLHLWSLGVEMQFYLVWSIILVVLIKFRLNILVAIAALFLTSLFIFYTRTTHQASSAFYMLDARGWQLLIGAAFAYLDSRKYSFTGRLKKVVDVLSPLGVLSIIFSLLIITLTEKFNVYAAFMASIGTGLIIYGGMNSRFNQKVLCQPVAVFIGKISYPLYLWHWPLMVLGFAYWGSEIQIYQLLMLIVISTVLGWMTYKWVEPAFRLSKNQSALTLVKISSLLIALLVLGFLGQYVYKHKGLVQRLGYSQEASAWVGVGQDDFKWGLHVRSGTCHIQSTKSADVKPTCIEAGDKDLLIIWGDSYASSLYPGMVEHQKDNGMTYRLGQLTSAGCPPYLDVNVTDHRKNCGEINQKSIELIRTSQPKWLLIHANYRDPRNHLSFEEELKQLGQTIAKIQSLERPPIIYLVGQMPLWKKDLPEILSELVIKDPDHDVPKQYLGMDFLDKDLWEVDDRLKNLAKRQGVVYLSPLQIFCDKGQCLTRVGNEPLDALSIDRGHLSSRASMYVIKNLFSGMQFH